MLRERITRALTPEHPEAEHQGIVCIVYKPKDNTVKIDFAGPPETYPAVTIKNVKGISTQEEDVLAQIDGRTHEFTVCAGKGDYDLFDGYMDYGDNIFKFWKPRYGIVR